MLRNLLRNADKYLPTGNMRESAPTGWGLRLYLARKLIEAQGGAIGALSPLAPDHPLPGNEFYGFVPMAEIAEDE
ncbi:MAG: hypothetical protein ABIV92_04690 [Thermoflexales bacterium]